MLIYRKTADFYVLFLYHATSHNVFETSGVAFIEPYHLQIKIFDFFLSSLYLLYFFLLSFAVAKTSSTIVNRSWGSGQPCLVPGFGGLAESFEA